MVFQSNRKSWACIDAPKTNHLHNRPNAVSAQVKVFTMLYEIRDGLLCYNWGGTKVPPYGDPKYVNPTYECLFKPVECAAGFDKCNPYVNVTEKFESMDDWNRRFVDY
jgi:hypothetical protein